MDRIKYAIGSVLAKTLPNKANHIRNDFTIPNYFFNSGHIVDKFIRFYVGHEALKEEIQKPGNLESIHKNYWSNTDFYFPNFRRTDTIYINLYKNIVEETEKILIDRNIESICEFGTGDGSWLNYLHQEWPFIKKLIGIDISENQINKNKADYQGLEFYASDLVAWAKKNPTPNTLYHTNSGVLEYLSEGSVSQLFQSLKEKARNSVILLIEPIHGDFDLEKDEHSKIIGFEHSYTHNYPKLLQNAGIELLKSGEIEAQSPRMFYFLAYIK